MPISLLQRRDFSPMPFHEAAERFGKRIALPSDVFDRLSKEAKKRAFRIAGLHKANQVQRARNLVKRAIREGTDFSRVQQQLRQLFDHEKLSPPNLTRLRLMFRHVELRAYADERNEVYREVADTFPYKQYLTVGNGTPGINGVRATHAALHGLVFRADDPFWRLHDPPWEWGCRCFTVVLTPGQVDARGVEVRDLNYVRTELAVVGQAHRGITAERSLVADEGADLTKLDAELQLALQEATQRRSDEAT